MTRLISSCSGNRALIQRVTTQHQVAESEAGLLLADLERRQDDVLAQLDELDKRLCGILKGLGVTPVAEERGDFGSLNPDDSSAEANPLSFSQFRTGQLREPEVDDFGGGFSKPPQERLDGLVGPDRRANPQTSRQTRAA
jgi:hypothetical protein